MDEKKSLNRCKIDLRQGLVEIESNQESVDYCCRKAEEIAKKMSTNKNTEEWGIS